MGFQVHMDDFGSGYSALNMLKDIQVDTLKIDMKFLYGQDQSKRSVGILKAVTDMARAIQANIIAEGVETESQARMLLGVGCETIQGYYFSRPIPAEEMTSLIALPDRGVDALKKIRRLP